AATHVVRHASVLTAFPSSHASGPFTMPSPQRGPSALHVALHAPYMPLREPSSQTSVPSRTPLPHTADGTYSYAPMSYAAPPMPSPSSGRDAPSRSVEGAPVAVPTSMHRLDAIRWKSLAETYCGFAEMQAVPATAPE